MFAFNLPERAGLLVKLPTGGEAMMVHVGGGRFISRVPPLVLHGPGLPGEDFLREGLPLEWDSTTLKQGVDVGLATFVFDAAGGQRAIEEAAAAGDAEAKGVLEELNAAQRQMEARDLLMRRKVGDAPAQP